MEAAMNNNPLSDIAAPEKTEFRKLEPDKVPVPDEIPAEEEPPKKKRGRPKKVQNNEET
jgi:hypothetical protein